MLVTSRPLVVAFGAVVLAFLSATGYSAYRSLAIDRAALSIAHEDAPGIQHLAEGRAGIRELQLLATRYARGGSDRPRPVELDRAWRRFESEFWDYFALRPHAGEAQQAAKLQASLLDLNQKIWRLLQRIGPGDGEDGDSAALFAEVGAAADQTARLALELLEATASRSHDLALRIEAAHHGSLQVAFGLDVLCMLLSAVAATLLFRSLRQQAALAEAHERLLAARADELEQFAGRVAHDVLGPLSAAMVSIDLARRSADERAGRLLARGQSSILRVKEIVQALLDFARGAGEELPRGRAEVRAIVDGIVEELRPDARAANAELRVEPFADCAVACPPGILTSLLSNLARNALKYLGDERERRVSIRVAPRESLVRVEVEDTGPGIPRAFEREVFKPYVRVPGSKREGLGLGLAIVKRFAEAYGGAAGVHAAAGRGSVFWFELPAAPSPSPEVSAAPPS